MARSEWVNTSSRHSQPSCVECVLSRPDKQPQWPWITQTIADISEQFSLTCHLINTPQWFNRVCFDLSQLDRVGTKLPVKVELFI